MFLLKVARHGIRYEMNGHLESDELDSLQNAGTGKIMDLEITVEKFLSGHGYISVYGSFVLSLSHTGSDGKERNTALNGNFTLNYFWEKNGK